VRSGVLGDVEVDDASAMVSEHDEDEEHAQARGGHREEIEGDQASDVVVEERPPSLRRQGAPLRHEPGDGALGHVDAELQELTMDSRGAPERIRRGHSPDQGFDLGVDGRATASRPGGEPGPVLAEAAPLPPQDSVGRHNQEGLLPLAPNLGQPDPEKAVRRTKLGSGCHSLVHSELLAQGQVLEGELAVAAEEEGQETEQVEQEGDHRAGIVSGTKLTDQRPVCRTGFWRRKRRRVLRAAGRPNYLPPTQWR